VRATLIHPDGWLAVLSGATVVTTDHDERLEIVGKSDDYGQ
jgi:hypothetical protein